MGWRLKHLASNLGGGFDVPLPTDKVLILGPNESGKTMRLRALELALSGGAEDVAGRAWVKHTGQLLTMAPGRVGQLWSTITLLDDEGKEHTARWEIDGKHEGHAPKATHDLPPVLAKATVLPLQALRDEVTASPERAARFLLTVACQAVTVADLKSLIPVPLHSRFWAAAGRTEATAGDAVQALLAARTRSNEEANKSKAAAANAEELVNGFAGVTSPPTTAELAAAEASAKTADDAYVALRTRAARALAARQSQEHVDALARARADVERQTTEANARLAQLEAKLASIVVPAQPDEARGRNGLAIQITLQRQVAVLSTSTTSSIGGGTAACALCSTSFDRSVLLDKVNRNLTAVSGAIVKLTADIAAYKAAVKLRGDTTDSIEVTRQHLVGLKAQWERLQAPAVTIAQETSPTEAELVAAGNAVTAARAAHNVLANRAGSWDRVKEARLRVKGLQDASEEWKALTIACNEAATALVASAVERFKERVQRYLPAEDVFQLRLKDDSGKDVFQFGLLRDGLLHTALSGAAWARTLAAIGAAMSEGSPLSVIIPEERAYDPDTLAGILKALAKAPGTIVLTSPVAPTGKVPAAWTVIDLGLKKRAKRTPATAEDTAKPAVGLDDLATNSGAGATDGSASVEQVPAPDPTVAVPVQTWGDYRIENMGARGWCIYCKGTAVVIAGERTWPYRDHARDALARLFGGGDRAVAAAHAIALTGPLTADWRGEPAAKVNQTVDGPVVVRLPPEPPAPSEADANRALDLDAGEEDIDSVDLGFAPSAAPTGRMDDAGDVSDIDEGNGTVGIYID